MQKYNTYFIYGKVYPELEEEINEDLVYHNKDKVSKIYSMKLRINKSEVTCTCESIYTLGQVGVLKNLVEHTISGYLGVEGYCEARPYYMHIEYCVSLDEKTQVFFSGSTKQLKDLISRMPNGLKKEDYRKAITKYHRLINAFIDLNEAQKTAWDSGFYCYRVFDTIRHFFCIEADTDKGVSWVKMRDALRMSKEWINYAKEYAEKQRHGDHCSMASEAKLECGRRACIAINRFCYYILNDCKELSAEDYPYLDDGVAHFYSLV